MDPEYRDYLMIYMAQHGIEFPLPEDDVNDVDYAVEEEEEEEEEDDDDDGEATSDEEEEVEEVNGDGADVDEPFDSNGNGVNSVRNDDDDAKRSDNHESETASLKDGDGGELGEFNRGEVDGLFCPICFEAWSSGGDHNICCLPCGHIYGLSCIKKWLARRGSNKCPQCKKKCTMKDIRLLYANRLVAIDGELQKTVRTLEAKCASLEKKGSDWSKKEAEWKNKEGDLCKKVRYLKERTHDLEKLLESEERRASAAAASSWNCLGKSTLGTDANPNFHMQGCSNTFVMQKDFRIDGARLFDIDSSSEIYVFARRLLGMGGVHVLTKVSLSSNHEKEDIRLPENTKVVKDLRVSPHAKLVLLASLGKKLSVLSTASNNTILTYDLPAAAWSCSWDISSSHYAYVGLQNGTVLQFDMRYTTRHVESLTGLTCNPIHTLYSLAPDSSLSSGIRSVLTASSRGLCQWNFGGSEERPYIVPESDTQGVCISLAHCKSSDDIVASYRPKIEIPDSLEISQPILTAPGQGTRGSHVLYRKIGTIYQKLGATCANVSDIRLPKSAIIDGVYENRLFASGDELTHELVLQELPSLMAVDRLKPKNNPIRDVKYIRHINSGLLSCLTDDSLQLFTAKLL